eukprot:5693970-Pyramimonas_sp.AAC.1
MDRPFVVSWLKTDLTAKGANNNVAPAARPVAVGAGTSGTTTLGAGGVPRAPAGAAVLHGQGGAGGASPILPPQPRRALTPGELSRALKETASHEIPFSQYVALAESGLVDGVDFLPDNKMQVSRGDQSCEGRENIPAGGTNHVREERTRCRY